MAETNAPAQSADVGAQDMITTLIEGGVERPIAVMITGAMLLGAMGASGDRGSPEYREGLRHMIAAAQEQSVILMVLRTLATPIARARIVEELAALHAIHAEQDQREEASRGAHQG
jgi:hypothetical protein